MGKIPISQNVSMALQVEGKVKAKAQRWESTVCSGNGLAGTSGTGETSYTRKISKRGWD